MYGNDDKYTEAKLKEANKYEDTLDVFLHIIILRLPTVFILINMILMIWLVQTIFNSLATDSLPRSLYFFAPLLPANPITALYFSVQPTCQPEFQQLNLKTFPAITSSNINHNNLTKWKQSLILCAKKSQKLANFSAECNPDQKYCSGLCINQNNTDNCPITTIRKVYTFQPMLPGEQILYKSDSKNYQYVYSRQSKNTHIVGISAQHEDRCANQFYYFDTFNTFEEYWNATKQCGNQGFLSPEFYHPFDSMQSNQFLFANSIWSEQINKIIPTESVTELGYMNKIKFKNATECQQVEVLSRSIPQKLASESVSSFYSKNLLIISFVLFTLCWAWLIAVYCCETPFTLQKSNIVVILLSITEFIAIAFIYYQNLQLVSLQNEVSLISNCISQPMPAFQNWSFNISNRYPMISLIFVCSCFLLMQVSSYFVSYCIYEEYQQVEVRGRGLEQSGEWGRGDGMVLK